MGSIVEINDTLKIKRTVDFQLTGKEIGYELKFKVKGKRVYNLSPSRVYLVEEIDGLWNYVGHALINELIIDAINDETSGTAIITVIYSEEYRKKVNKVEPPKGKNYLG